MSPEAPPKPPREGLVLALLAGVQFVNILDFMMVMPLGPRFAVALSVSVAKVPIVASSYTIAAGIAGFLGAFFLDRFDRKPALLVCLLGLSVGTILGGLAPTFPLLLVARVIAGIFGGPATSLSLAIVADLVPPERRGAAIGKVMTAFSVATVLGVPTGLYLAGLGGYRLPFYAVGGLGLVIAALAAPVLPSFTGHLSATREAPPTFRALARGTVLAGLGIVVAVCVAAFVIIPSIATFFTANLHVPQESLGGLYMAGGLVSLLATLLGGRIVDRLGAGAVGAAAAVLVAITTFFAFYLEPPRLSPLAVFLLFMLGNSYRNVALSTVQSKIPSARERARYGSLQSCVQHLASGGAGLVAAKLLTEDAAHALVGMPKVALVSLAATAVVVPWLYLLARAVDGPTIAAKGA